MLGQVFARFIEKSPVSVMVRGMLERATLSRTREAITPPDDDCLCHRVLESVLRKIKVPELGNQHRQNFTRFRSVEASQRRFYFHTVFFIHVAEQVGFQRSHSHPPHQGVFPFARVHSVICRTNRGNFDTPLKKISHFSYRPNRHDAERQNRQRDDKEQHDRAEQG